MGSGACYSHVVLVALLLGLADAGAEPLELGPEVRSLYDVVTCSADAGASAYCKRIEPHFARFKRHWGAKTADFVKAAAPHDLPGELVYPFGGGDLMMALAAFPQASVITTLSLELAGDPRRLRGLSDERLKASLDALFEASASTLSSNDSKSVNLSKIQQGDLPGQLSMHLMGLWLNGQVPVSARFFRIESDGALHYYTADEVTAMESQMATQLKASWRPPDFSLAFANVELKFTPREAPESTPRVFRHIGANLSNEGQKQAPGVLKHLEAKGPITAMTKAASYLLWREEFSATRTYLTGHARFMISDSTGVLPRFWPKQCVVKTYGAFQQSFLRTWEPMQKELATEFLKQPQRALPMRFGYPDGSPERQSHLFTVECP